MYRFDGSTWSTTGGYQTNPVDGRSGSNEPAFALDGADALVGWRNVDAGAVALIVQRNTPSGWTPVGTGLGELPQYQPHAITPNQFALDQRLLATGGQVFMVFVHKPDGDGSTLNYKVTLVRKVAN